MAVNRYSNVSDDELSTSFIEYKELKKEDFENFNVGRDFLQDIENKYLSEVISDYIDLDESNTVVINSSVGQGKSVFAIDLAKDYYLQKKEDGNYKYTIIFAAPYKTLVEQYIEKITFAINKTGSVVNIPDYAKLKLKSDNINQVNDVCNAILSRMHVVTVNFLLANPGDDAIEQNILKRDYLKGIIKNCVKEKRKVVIIFDEIHDAIYNFKQEYIFYLWRFKTNKLLHKTFILSATFNEASKVVIKYIAELTNKNLQIIETPRIQQKDNLSNLHIHLTKDSLYGGYNFDSQEFVELFTSMIDKHQNLNILSFSQKLCNKMASGKIGVNIREALLAKYGRINICIAEEHHPTSIKKKKEIPSGITYSNKYIPGMCNIGTTFKTGISIEEENSGFVIILPSENSMQGYVKSGDYGVFTNGTIPIIQALARVRRKSDIYVIMPFPKQYIRESNSFYLTNEDYIWNVLKNDILKHDVFMDFKWSYIHHLYPIQYELLSRKYKEKRERVKKEIKAVEKIENKRKEEMLPFLKYPTLDMFILEEGEKYLYTTFAIFGKDLPAYMIWAAYNNQFVNCKLKELSSSNEKERLELENVLEFFYSYVENRYDISNIITTYDYAIYDSLCQRISSEFELSEYNNELKKFQNLSDDKLEKYIMTFVQMALKGNGKLHDNYYEKDSSGHIIDKPFEVKDYLLCCMANTILYNGNEIIDVYPNDSVIKAYKDLYYKVRKIFIDKILKQHDNIKYIYPTFDKFDENTDTPLNGTEIDLILQTIKIIREQDIHFKCFRKFQTVKFQEASKNKDLNSIYSELKELFFTLKKGQKLPVSRINVDFVNEIIELPGKRTGLNLLYKYEYIQEENYDNDILEEIMYNEYIPSHEEMEAMLLYNTFEEDNFNEKEKQFLKEFRENQDISENQ